MWEIRNGGKEETRRRDKPRPPGGVPEQQSGPLVEIYDKPWDNRLEEKKEEDKRKKKRDRKRGAHLRDKRDKEKI